MAGELEAVTITYNALCVLVVMHVARADKSGSSECGSFAPRETGLSSVPRGGERPGLRFALENSF